MLSIAGFPDRLVTSKMVIKILVLVKLPDGIGIVQPLALAVATGGGNQATYTR